jgi:hypothetical protein
MGGPSVEQVTRAATIENQLWHMIRKTAANDPALKEMLDQVKVFYLLKYDNKNHGQNSNTSSR